MRFPARPVCGEERAVEPRQDASRLRLFDALHEGMLQGTRTRGVAGRLNSRTSMQSEYQVDSVEETWAVAKELAKELKSGDVVWIAGETSSCEWLGGSKD